MRIFENGVLRKILEHIYIYMRVKATGEWGNPLTTLGLMISITQEILNNDQFKRNEKSEGCGT